MHPYNMPADLAEIIAVHRSLFGGFVMQADDTEPAGDEPAEAAPGDTSDKDDLGFPANTPLRDMTAEQREAYWKDKARKHEATVKARADYDQLKSERDQLRAASMTADEKALEDAKKAAFEEGKQAGIEEFAPRLVKAELSGALRARGLSADKVAELIGPIDHSFFLSEDGEVDTDKVSNYAAGFGGGQWPDMGQGKRGTSAPAKGVAAGRELFADTRGKTK